MAKAVGDKITADWANWSRPRYIKKPGSTSITSSTTLANDPDFTVTLQADRTYRIRLNAVFTGATAGDAKTAWAITGGVAALSNRHCIGPTAGTADATNTSVRSNGAPGLTTGVGYGVDGTNGSRCVEEFLVETTTSGAAGTLTLQWAQNTSNATATVLNVNSFLIVEEIEAI